MEGGRQPTLATAANRLTLDSSLLSRLHTSVSEAQLNTRTLLTTNRLVPHTLTSTLLIHRRVNCKGAKLLCLHVDEGSEWPRVLSFDNGGDEDGDCTLDNGNPCCGEDE